MIKVLYGIDSLIDSYINEFIKKNKINQVIKYDYNDIDMDTVIEELLYPDLFGETKLVLLYNSKFLTSEETLDNSSFESIVSSKNLANHLFLIIYNDALDERKKIVKLLKNNTEVIALNKFNEYDAYNYIKKSFEDDNYKIDDKCIKEIISRLSLNFSLYENEIEKLKLYKINDKIINYEDVINITSKLPEDNVFKLVDAVIDNNKEDIFKIYNDLKSLGVDEILLISLLASQFRFMYQVKVLLGEGKNKNDIVNILKSHPYKTELTIKKVNLYKEDILINYLHKLSLIDIDIKTGLVDKNYAIENFFLNL